MSRALIVALVVSVLAPSANAYVVLLDQWGNPRTWAQSNVSWRLGAGGSQDVPFAQAQAAIEAAFDSWEGIPCASIGFTYAGTASGPGSPGVFVDFVESDWDISVQDAAGITTNWQIGGGGVTRVEIYFNGEQFTWTTSGADDPFSDANDIQAVAAHEIGHAIGLDHTRHRASTMWFSTFPGQSEAARSLESDDIRGACFLYPAVAFSEGQACDACGAHANCAGGTCFDFGAEGAYCGQACGAGLPCPDGFTCYQVDGVATPQCLPDNEHCAPEGGNIGLGQFCYDHGTCASGQCLVLPDSAVCSESCNPATGSGCPASMICLGQGTSGICYPKGSGQLGSSCLSPADCASFDCIGIGAGEGVCTQPCAGSGACPAGFQCAYDFCFAKGSGGFGDPCSVLTDCESSICLPFGRCSLPCAADGDCPGDSTCDEAAGVCNIGATGQVGDPCKAGGGECAGDLLCLVDAAGATQGVCRERCDIRFDGCSGGQLCEWIWQPWTQKVVGVCTADDGGAGEGEPCGVCKPGLVCAETGGEPPTCRHDCYATNLMGCPPGTSCVPLNLADDPKKGACHPHGGPAAEPPPEAPPVVEAPPAVAEPNEPISGDVGGPVTPADAGVAADRRGGGGGCQASSRTSGNAIGWMIAMLALGPWLRRRKECP